MHNNQSSALTADYHRALVRPARLAHVNEIWELVSRYTAQGLMLPRTHDQIAMNIDNYVVVAAGSRVLACAALEEYSPSLAEVSSVAVAESEHGHGLGTDVVLGVERLARARDIAEVFALSLSDRFFMSLEYQPVSISRYPEKLARYDILASQGIDIVPKRCFQKVLGAAWEMPSLVEDRPALQTLRAS
ncbi:MAG: GNAT family N-acetyltransferase [Gemmatimonadaceae bacterium]